MYGIAAFAPPANFPSFLAKHASCKTSAKILKRRGGRGREYRREEKEKEGEGEGKLPFQLL